MAYENIEAQYCDPDWAAGVDEAGRGPLAGDVIAAAVILGPNTKIIGLNDSKKLTAARRDVLFEQIISQATAYSIARASVAEIERYNILQATMMAMERAVKGLSERPHHILIDGNRLPKGLTTPATAIIKGDSRVRAISAASILAKVTRDRELMLADERYPGYGFAQHKGYPTAAHLQALATLGVCPIHRKTYKPVRDVIASGPKQMAYL